MITASGPHRIGEFARRVGVSPELLRAWEQRYGLLSPVRSPGGFRLYGDEDAERVARMRHGLDQGLSAAEAAAAALRPGLASDVSPAAASVDRLLDACRRFDEDAAHAVLDGSLAAFGVDGMLRELVLPALTQIGAEWEEDSGTIGVEHFASNLIRGRLLGLARLWGRGGGPLALLACAPGEEHDISLLAFGLLLRSYGWRIVFLGADIPVANVAQTAQLTDPEAIVITSFRTSAFTGEATALRRLARSHRLLLSGRGADAAVCRRIGATHLDGDVFSAAAALARPPGG
ncbi:MAG TPA: MerR family transcriptional regulator [Solirubrobacteraceae bacterium]|nr:MerR family transcriptional regulator [Solirubrobacteraceae bacterium]